MIRRSRSAHHCMIFTQVTSRLPLLEDLIGALVRVEDLFYDIFFFHRSPIGFPPDLELRNSCQHLHDKLTAWLSLAHAEASRRGGLAWALKVVGSLPLNTGCERKFIESQHHSNYKDLAPEFWLTE